MYHLPDNIRNTDIWNQIFHISVFYILNHFYPKKTFYILGRFHLTRDYPHLSGKEFFQNFPDSCLFCRLQLFAGIFLLKSWNRLYLPSVLPAAASAFHQPDLHSPVPLLLLSARSAAFVHLLYTVFVRRNRIYRSCACWHGFF